MTQKRGRRGRDGTHVAKEEPVSTSGLVEITSEGALVAKESGTALVSLPVAKHKGPMRIGEAKIMAFVLDDGRRMLSGRSVTNGLGLTGRGAGMARFLNSESLKPYISDKLREAITQPTMFVVSRGLPSATGYEAWVLPEICHTITDAWEAGVLHQSLAKTVDNAKMLIRGFSTVGIIALVDEATGYQAERERDALQELLAMYINPKLLPWAKTFGDDFYKEIFRLRGWKWESIASRRPRLVGKLTKMVIYDRLSPELLAELERLNPTLANGRRKVKHFQHLSEDYGMPALRIHKEGVTALMKASPNWNVFMRLLARAYPKPGQAEQEELAFFDDEDDE
jgi:hypothetical protein